MDTSLSDKEIKSLFDFTRSKYVRYRDVQMELVDHLASGIEALRIKDPEIGFVKALYTVYDEFGIFGFAKIVEAKEKAMTRFWMKRIWKYFRQFFHLPRILATIGSMILLYYVFHFNILKPESIKISFGIIVFLITIKFCYKEHVIDENMKQFLYIRSFHVLSFSYLGFIYYSLYMVDDFLTSIFQFSENFLMVFMAFVIPMCFIMMYLILFKIPGELRNEFDNKYSRYLDIA